MPSNWGMHFMTDGFDDHILKSAVSIVDILEAPGLFMYTVGITDEDIEAREPAIGKVESWLKAQYEGPWN